MMERPYFEKVPDIGDLFLDFCFIEFEQEPIVFTCISADKELFLCTCSEIRYEQRWFISRTDVSTLRELIERKIDIKSAMCRARRHLMGVTMNLQGEETHKWVLTSEICELDLPKEGTFLRKSRGM